MTYSHITDGGSQIGKEPTQMRVQGSGVGDPPQTHVQGGGEGVAGAALRLRCGIRQR